MPWYTRGARRIGSTKRAGEDEEVLSGLFQRQFRWDQVLRCRARAHAALVALILVFVLADDTTSEPLPSDQPEEVAPLVDQLVPPLIAAPLLLRPVRWRCSLPERRDIP